jgi:adenine deaminase
MSRAELVDVALGKAEADLFITGGRLINVASAEIYEADIAIKGERIAAVGRAGEIDFTKGASTEILDVEGRFLSPGLVDAHLHSYHAYIGVPEFTEALLINGVTCWADAFYGQGTVGGKEAVRFFKEAFERMPVRLLFLVPCLAYIQNRDLGLTPAPGVSPEDMVEMLEWDGCIGLEEPPSTPFVEHWPELMDLAERTLKQRKVITGHASAIPYGTLQAYAAIGCTTDHEAVSTQEGLDRLRSGFNIFMRMSTAARHQDEVLKAHTEHGLISRSIAFCSDEASPIKLVDRGTSLENLRSAIAQGTSPIEAVQMGTINAASAFFVQHDVGVIAAGRYADILVVDDLTNFEISKVIVGGKTRVENGELVEPLPKIEYPESSRNTVQLKAPITADDLATKVDASVSDVRVRVIGVIDRDYVSQALEADLKAENGIVKPDIENDILPLAMVDRLGKGTGIGAGFVKGFGLKRGAIASSVNAVCQNLVAVGASTEEMAFAMNKLAEIGGGFIVVDGTEIKALAELPIFGLINDEPLDVCMPKFRQLNEAAAELGTTLSNPFTSLEFTFACGAIPDIKMSDEGLVRTFPAEKLDVVISAS